MPSDRYSDLRERTKAYACRIIRLYSHLQQQHHFNDAALVLGKQLLRSGTAVDEARLLRHLSILGRPVYLRIRPKRFRCPHYEGHLTTTQQLDWYDPAALHTKAYERHLIVLLITSTLTDVAAKEDVLRSPAGGSEALDRLHRGLGDPPSVRDPRH